jgi:hypothetical protein
MILLFQTFCKMRLTSCEILLEPWVGRLWSRWEARWEQGSGIRQGWSEFHRNSPISGWSKTNLVLQNSNIPRIDPKSDRNLTEIDRISPISVGTEIFPKLNPKTLGESRWLWWCIYHGWQESILVCHVGQSWLFDGFNGLDSLSSESGS